MNPETGIMCRRAPARRANGPRHGTLSRFGLAQRGAAALETVLIVPVMIFIIIASVELYQYYRAIAILDRAAFTVANGITMQRELKDRSRCSDTDDICAYGAIMRDLTAPLNYDTDGRVIISLYQVVHTSDEQYVWKHLPTWQRSYSGAGYPGTPESALRPPEGFPPPLSRPHADSSLDSVVVVEVFLEYEPFAISSTFWTALGGRHELTSQAYYRPRFADLATLSR